MGMSGHVGPFSASRRHVGVRTGPVSFSARRRGSSKSGLFAWICSAIVVVAVVVMFWWIFVIAFCAIMAPVAIVMAFKRFRARKVTAVDTVTALAELPALADAA